jgi:N-(2-amino-2-carboxyethyl)-L-glutamate synthase
MQGGRLVSPKSKASVLAEFKSAVGNTPTAYIDTEICGDVRRIGIKLESENPCGSIKDRTAVNLLESFGVEILNNAELVVESTSGNTGVALAYLTKMMQLQFIAVVDPKVSGQLISRLEDLEAVIEMVTTPDAHGNYLSSRIERVLEICGAQSGTVWPNQYSNPASPAVHYDQTGPEIDRQADGKVDAVFAAVSTGGTLAGISRYFREVRPSVKVVGVDAVGSEVFGGAPGPRRLTGIGASRKSDFLSPDMIDDFTLISDEVAFAFCRALLSATGLCLGGSSGAVVAACAGYLARHPEIKFPVCIAADHGSSYAATIFDDAYLRREGIELTPGLLRPQAGKAPVKFRRRITS